MKFDADERPIVEWDYFAPRREFDVLETGPLTDDTDWIRVERDENHQLRCEAHGPPAPSPYDRSPLGAVIEDVPDVEVENQEGRTGIIEGLIIDRRKGLNEVQIGRPYRISLELSREEPKRLIEWVLNFPQKLRWPDVTQRIVDDENFWRHREVYGDEILSRGDVKELITGKATANMGPDHLSMNFSDEWGMEIVVGKVDSEVVGEEWKPGFIEFVAMDSSGLPSRDFRKRVRDALSFIVGRKIVNVGATFFDDKGSATKAVGMGNCLSGRKVAIRRGSQIPAPLTLQKGSSPHQVIDPPVVEAYLKGLIDIWSKPHFIQALGRYFNGHVAYAEMRGVAYGSALETVLDIQRSKTDSSHRLLDKDVFRELRDQLEGALEDFGRDVETKAVKSRLDLIRRRLSNLNQSQPSDVLELFDDIGLEIGPVERDAWHERNRAAHGDVYASSDYEAGRQRCDALMTMFNRLLLKLCGAGTKYFDYTTLDWPVRDLDDPLKAGDKDKAESE